MCRACAISQGVTSMSRDAAAEDGQHLAVALRHALTLLAVFLETQVEDFGAGHRLARTDALACRLTKRSALLLLASAARSSRPTL